MASSCRNRLAALPGGERTAFGTCAAGIARMDGKQASVTVVSPKGERFTMNFMAGYINAANRKVQARRPLARP